MSSRATGERLEPEELEVSEEELKLGLEGVDSAKKEAQPVEDLPEGDDGADEDEQDATADAEEDDGEDRDSGDTDDDDEDGPEADENAEADEDEDEEDEDEDDEADEDEDEDDEGDEDEDDETDEEEDADTDEEEADEDDQAQAEEPEQPLVLLADGAPDPDTFLSGERGTVAGIRLTTRAKAGDLRLNWRLRRAKDIHIELDRAADAVPDRDVLAISIYRPGTELLAGAAEELYESRHRVRLACGATEGAEPALAEETIATDLAGGKFENVNTVLRRVEEDGEPAPDWLLVLDDDVALPEGFLDRFVGVCEALDLALAQPAQTLRSHAAWRVTRRRADSIARETRFVEIGPVTAFSRAAQDELLPFPPLRYGWGLDSHWGALAVEHGWRIGVVDALPVRHNARPVATSYPHEEAVDEAVRFLTGKPYVPTQRAQETVEVHRNLLADA